MAALSSGRNTQSKGNAEHLGPFPVEAATVVYTGSIVAVDDNGLAVPAQAKTGTTPFVGVPIVVGVMNNVVDGEIPQDAHNVSGYPMIPAPANLGSASAISIEVLDGIFLFDNDTTNAVTQATVGKVVFAVNDHTVGTSDLTTTLPAVGTVVGINALGVWVDTRKKTTPTA